MVVTNLNLRIDSPCMTKYLNLEFDDEDEFERLKAVKDREGLTWKGMLHHARRELDRHE